MRVGGYIHFLIHAVYPTFDAYILAFGLAHLMTGLLFPSLKLRTLTH